MRFLVDAPNSPDIQQKSTRGRRYSTGNAARRPAREDGVSLNQWISSAGSRKVGSVETAAACFKQRAGGADGAAMMRFLADAPDLPKPDLPKESGEKSTTR